MAWEDERYLLVWILNTLNVIASGARFVEIPDAIKDPLAIAAEREAEIAAEKSREKAKRVRETLRSTRWKEVELDV